MRTFPCACGNPLFFESTLCLNCQQDTGMCPACRQVVPLVKNSSSELRCGNTACGVELKKCVNFATENICNRCINLRTDSAELLCDYCRLTQVIPNLAIAGNRTKWVRLERAKHRVLYIVDEIRLPFRSSSKAEEPVLSFEFKTDESQPVQTGHIDGRIIINLREADHVEREKARVAFQEPQRTLVGHFRHELGHYFWSRLVAGKRDDACRALFGDERSLAYSEALSNYYANGPIENWRENFVTAYATMHPWEDFAETFGTYLDMVSVTETGNHFQVATCSLDDFDAMILNYTRIGLIANEFNRDMGLIDLVPEVFVPPVVEKLRFVHSLRTEYTAPPAQANLPPPEGLRESTMR